MPINLPTGVKLPVLHTRTDKSIQDNAYFDSIRTSIVSLAEATTTGTQGPPGQSATVSVGTTSTGAPGTPASVSNVGSSSVAILDFVIPQGIPGPPVTVTRQDYSGVNWDVTWILLGNFCVGCGVCVEGSVITVPPGFPVGNFVWSGAVRTIWGYLNPGDAILSLDFYIPNGGNTCTLCRSMKSNDGDTWRTTAITGEFVGLGYM